jgi:cellulose synthase/poly-beta-1,6-N-acetylglucosamine synthase-like glycosyltransferase
MGGAAGACRIERTMNTLGMILVFGPVALVLYTYAGYPAVLWLVARRRPAPATPEVSGTLPTVSITVPVYNEESQVRGLLDSLLALDYPEQHRQILIISDASSDATDSIVTEYAHRGVELLRMPERTGKTSAENAGMQQLRGEIVVNTDASIRVHPAALKALVSRFADPTVGVASGRDVSTAAGEGEGNAGEAGYVDFEMRIRQLETRVSGIVGASGCLYAIRRELHRTHVPAGLSRDFSAALNARRAGFRAVSVDEALCYVPRVPSLHREYRRKVRTITRGLQTLAYNRVLLNPLRHGTFAWMLLSHKLCRWLVPWGVPMVVTGLVLLAAAGQPLALTALALTALVGAVAAAGWLAADSGRLPRPVAIVAFVAAANVATLHAWLRAFGGRADPIWEPTRRDAAGAVSAAS